MPNFQVLQVSEAYTRDVGRGIARFDYDSIKSLGALKGDVVEIVGSNKRTVAKCLPLFPVDVGKGMIRIDGLVRKNADVAVGSTIAATRKIKEAIAEKVIVSPVETMPPIDERYLADALEGVPFIKGDILMVPQYPPEEGLFVFKVIEVTPSTVDAVIVVEDTIFTIDNSKQVEVLLYPKVYREDKESVSTKYTKAHRQA